jgi:hypothetical protein
MINVDTLTAWISSPIETTARTGWPFLFLKG